MYRKSASRSSGQQLLSLIELIYSAAGQSELWPHVLDRISDVTSGESIALFTRLPKDSILALSRFQPGSWEQYAEYYAGVNVLATRCDDLFPEGTVRYSQRAMSNVEFENTEFYSDFFRRYDMHYSIGVKVPIVGCQPAYLSCQRAKAGGPFEESEGRVYLTLLPHLQRALGLHLRLTELEAKSKGLEEAIDAFGHAIIGIDSERKVLFASRSAELLARKGDGLRIVDGRVSAVHASENNRLLKALDSALTLKSNPPSFSITRKFSGTLNVALYPFRSCAAYRASRLSALIFISESSSPALSRSAVLRNLFQLTPTELRITDCLVSGIETGSISQQLGLTMETTRFYVKRILAKTGSKRQLDLVRMVIGLPSLTASSPS